MTVSSGRLVDSHNTPAAPFVTPSDGDSSGALPVKSHLVKGSVTSPHDYLRLLSPACQKFVMSDVFLLQILPHIDPSPPTSQPVTHAPFQLPPKTSRPPPQPPQPPKTVLKSVPSTSPSTSPLLATSTSLLPPSVTSTSLISTPLPSTARDTTSLTSTLATSSRRSPSNRASHETALAVLRALRATRRVPRSPPLQPQSPDPQPSHSPDAQPPNSRHSDSHSGDELPQGCHTPSLNVIRPSHSSSPHSSPPHSSSPNSAQGSQSVRRDEASHSASQPDHTLISHPDSTSDAKPSLSSLQSHHSNPDSKTIGTLPQTRKSDSLSTHSEASTDLLGARPCHITGDDVVVAFIATARGMSSAEMQEPITSLNRLIVPVSETGTNLHTREADSYPYRQSTHRQKRVRGGEIVDGDREGHSHSASSSSTSSSTQSAIFSDSLTSGGAALHLLLRHCAEIPLADQPQRLTSLIDRLIIILGDVLTLTVCACLITTAIHEMQCWNQLSSLPHYPMAHSRCAVVWDGHHVAYRCFTCGGSLASCICVGCFRDGTHVGHDYVLYRSEFGGSCDCGDSATWDPNGFCRRHCGPPAIDVDFSSVLPVQTYDRMGVVCGVLVRRLVALVLSDGLMHNRDMEARIQAVEKALSIVNWLFSVCELHEGLRRAAGEQFLRPLGDLSQLESCQEVGEGIEGYQDRARFMLKPAYQSKNQVGENCALDVLLKFNFRPMYDDYSGNVFKDAPPKWITLVSELHSSIVSLQLDLMLDLSFKSKFGRVFLQHYPTLIARDDQALDRVTVQLFSVKEVLFDLLEHEELLPILFNTTIDVLKSAVTEFTSAQQGGVGDRLTVVELGAVREKKGLSHSATNLRYILDTTSVLETVLRSPSHLYNFWQRGWLQVFRLCQSLNPHARRCQDHVVYEVRAWYRGLLMTSEHSYVIQAVTSLCQSIDPIDIVWRLAAETWKVLREWLDERCDAESRVVREYRQLTSTGRRGEVPVGCEGDTQWDMNPLSERKDDERRSDPHLIDEFSPLVRYTVSRRPVSLHLVLHRLLATLTHTLALRCELSICEVLDKIGLTTHYERMRMFEHPLRAVVMHHQVLTCAMWRRNGNFVHHEATSYRRPFWSAYFLDPDLLALRLVSAATIPEQVFNTLLSRFEVPTNITAMLTNQVDFSDDQEDKHPHSFSPTPHTSPHVTDSEFLIQKLQSLLISLTYLINPESPSLSLTPRLYVKYNLTHQLLRGPCTHSQLTAETEKANVHLVDEILDEIADYRPAGPSTYQSSSAGMNPGLFTVKDECWANYDPTYPYYQWSEFQSVESSFRSTAERLPNLKNDWVPPTRRYPPPFVSLAEGYFKFYRHTFLLGFTVIMGVATASACMCREMEEEGELNQPQLIVPPSPSSHSIVSPSVSTALTSSAHQVQTPSSPTSSSRDPLTSLPNLMSTPSNIASRLNQLRAHGAGLF
eukprot:GHVN01076466.1.p1 GENE.GHVN01076466.1~~GHVN01076466.1.p1  ORF type:complete len:1450 (+),score=337.48 GHVN01076466.1:220-4569(+)